MGMEMGKQEMRRRAAPLRRCTPTAAANRQAGNWLGGLRPASGEAATRRGQEDRSRRVAPSVVAPGSVRHRRGRRTRDADGGRECRRLSAAAADRHGATDARGTGVDGGWLTAGTVGMAQRLRHGLLEPWTVAAWSGFGRKSGGSAAPAAGLMDSLQP